MAHSPPINASMPSPPSLPLHCSSILTSVRTNGVQLATSSSSQVSHTIQRITSLLRRLETKEDGDVGREARAVARGAFTRVYPPEKKLEQAAQLPFQGQKSPYPR
jgi:hypothetical protein